MDYKHDLNKMARDNKRARQATSDKKELAKPPRSVFNGKPVKKKGKTNSENNHNKPRGFHRVNVSFTNYLARLGLTDVETKHFYKTGEMPARLKKEES